MVAYNNKAPQILEIGTKEDYVLSPIKMITSDNLVFVIKAGTNGKGNKKYCLYYEDKNIVQ